MENVNNIFEKYNYIFVAYLFGSAAKGKPNKESDIDIAILLDIKNIDENKIFETRLNLMNELEKYFKRKTEVIILNNAPLLLQHEAVSCGKPIYVKDNDKRLEYESLCRRAYFDFQYILSIHTASFLTCLKEKKLDECTRSNRFKT